MEQTVEISSNILLNIEKVLIVIVVLYQIYLFYKVIMATNGMKKIFEEKYKLTTKQINELNDVIEEGDYGIDDDLQNEGADLKEVVLITTDSNNHVNIRIKDSINSYLQHNFGAPVNFSILKDIVDREVDIEDSSVANSVQTPLYLGLAATMIGIILGLFAMPSIEGDSFTEGINSLITGIKYAMIASLLGLGFTTILTTFFYKKAKKVLEEGKSEQLSDLQAYLLPVLISAEETGIAGLKSSLDYFSRNATEITDKVTYSTQVNAQNLQHQLNILEKVEKINVTRVSKTNLELFDKLDSSMHVFKEFTSNIQDIGVISNSLRDFANKVKEVDVILNQMKEYMKDSYLLNKYLTEHLKKIEDAGGQSIAAVNLAESHFSDAIIKLTEEVENRIKNLNDNSSKHDSMLNEIYNDIGNDLKNITVKHINELENAYKNALPHFEKLDHLKELPKLNQLERLETLNPINSNIEQEQSLLAETSNKIDTQLSLLKEIRDNLSKSLNKQNKSKNVGYNEGHTIIDNNHQNNEPIRNIRGFVFWFELVLKTAGWATIISYGIHSILRYYGYLN